MGGTIKSRSDRKYFFTPDLTTFLQRESVQIMAGLVKAKKYDWKDSNLALFGSDTEKEVRKFC